MVWVKFVHVAAIAIWSAGLICLPGLYLTRAAVPEGPQLHRLHAQVRFMYVMIISPAAFVGVGTGIALIFLRETFFAWFSLKLGLVGVMVSFHILTGLVIIRLFEEGNSYPRWRFYLVTLATVVVVTLIILVVLAKPPVPAPLPDVLSVPGGLAPIVEDLNPFQR